MVIAPIPVMDWKEIFRKRARAERKRAAQRQPHAAKFAAHHFREAFGPKAQANVALYHAVGDELDPWPLAESLMADGHGILLPVVVGKDEPLVFRLFDMEQGLVDGAYGIPVPPASAPEIIPDIVLVPLLAARRDGARLGMGGGYYDRTLTGLREAGEVLAVGYGYAAQLVDRFPVDPHDAFLDGFVSEAGATAFERRR